MVVHTKEVLSVVISLVLFTLGLIAYSFIASILSSVLFPIVQYDCTVCYKTRTPIHMILVVIHRFR